MNKENKEKFLLALKNLKEAIFPTEQKFKDEKLNDGTIIRYDGDAIKVGTPVMAVTDQGALPLPDGDYIIADDGVSFTIAAGVVTVVTGEEPVMPPPAGGPPANMSDASKAGAAAAKAVVESIIKETRFAEITKELSEEIATLKLQKETFATHTAASETKIAELEGKYKTVSEQFSKMFELIEAFAGQASADPLEGKGKNKTTAKELSMAFKAALKTN